MRIDDSALGTWGQRKPSGMHHGRLTAFSPQPIGTGWNAGSNEASGRSGYAEDCKSLHPGSIPGEASNIPRLKIPLFGNAFSTCVNGPFAIKIFFTC